jgi:tripartite-type tricarboxylate transporter receptor subunit TctC
MSMSGRLTGFLASIGRCIAAFGCNAFAFSATAVAEPVEDFYRGRTIDFYIGYTPGGTYDLYARLISRYMGEHLPGNPRIIPHNMAGSSSRTAAGFVFKVAPKDGTALVTLNQALVLEQAMGDKTLLFDMTQFNYIGNPIVVNNVVVTWAKSGVQTVDQAKVRELSMGATGGTTSSQYPRAMNALLGTKFKIIIGYPGGNEINLAMENGEVDGRGSNDWVSWKATRPDWLRDRKINILVQVGLNKEQDLPDVPLLSDLASNAEDQDVLKLLSSPIVMGRPILTSPDVSPDRIAALRRAFDATMRDPNFRVEAARMKLDIRPVTGEEMQRFVLETIRTTPATVAQRLSSVIAENVAAVTNP